ncbi:MAG TPA: LacI family DNA-binding transcriptional regulator [Streptosporangiaceae bacterium]|jgi:LacI family transcriptional regulator
MVVRRRDVAELAGVSPAVVSYVLNGGPRGVAPETRARVLAAVEQLGYRPNGIARSLRINRTMTLGLVVPDASNPFFAELAKALEEAAFGAGYTLLVGNATDDEERQTAYVRTFLQRQVDGVLLVPAHGPVACLPELQASKKPWVVLDRRVDLDDVSQVLVDNFGGAAEATRHLLGHGRRRIACLTGPADVMPSKDRTAGCRAALAEAGVRLPASLIRHVPFGRRAGYLAALDLFRDARRRPDAVFVSSDEQAVGLLRAFAKLGVACPDDVAVVSFDGIADAAYALPTLTTMTQPFTRLGQEGVGHLLARIAGESAGPRVSVLPVSLVVRGSCGCGNPADGDDGQER